MAYELDLPPFSRIHPVIHISLLRPYHGGNPQAHFKPLPLEIDVQLSQTLTDATIVPPDTRVSTAEQPENKGRKTKILEEKDISGEKEARKRLEVQMKRIEALPFPSTLNQSVSLPLMNCQLLDELATPYPMQSAPYVSTTSQKPWSETLSPRPNLTRLRRSPLTLSLHKQSIRQLSKVPCATLIHLTHTTNNLHHPFPSPIPAIHVACRTLRTRFSLGPTIMLARHQGKRNLLLG